MKRKFLLTFSGVLLLGLVGCGKSYSGSSSGASSVVNEQSIYGDSTSAESQEHAHVWVDATCTTPKTCSICGETDGEALGHTWPETICTATKTCTVCGETGGESEHVLDAHGKCEICYVQVGTELTPSNIDEYLDISVNTTGLESETIMKVDVIISPRKDCEYHVSNIQAYFYSGKENRVHQALVSESIFTEAVMLDEYGYGHREILVRPMSIRNGAYVKNPTLTKYEIDSVVGYVIE